MKLTQHVAARIAARLDRDGWPWPVTVDDVNVVYETGWLADKESLASAILQEFEEYGVEVSA